MTLKDIVQAIQAHNPAIKCKIQRAKKQILVTSEDWEGEQAALLSPYYQQRIEAGTFTLADLEALKVEADRIHKIGH